MKPTPNLTFIGGCPGSGKTTLAVTLAARSVVGVRVDTDLFFRFPVRPIDPSTPESAKQNAAVVRAYTRAARAFQEDGYAVYVDGVIGPWWLQLISAEAPNFEYVILHAELDTVLGRVANRQYQDSAGSGVVRVMHDQFNRLDGWEARTLFTDGKTTREVVEEFIMRQKAGDFRAPGD